MPPDKTTRYFTTAVIGLLGAGVAAIGVLKSANAWARHQAKPRKAKWLDPQKAHVR